MSKISKKTEFKCGFCGKIYKSYPAYATHQEVCVMRHRANDSDTPNFRLAHELWIHSFVGCRKKIDQYYFLTHKDYSFFYNFARFCIENKVNNPKEYMDWCIKERIKLPNWISDKTHEEYIKYMVIKEDPVTAVMRSIEFIKSLECDDYFLKTEVGTILTHIHMGRISPWFVLLHNDGKDGLFKKATSEQKHYFNKLINTTVWNVLIKKNIDVCESIRIVLKNERF